MECGNEELRAKLKELCARCKKETHKRTYTIRPIATSVAGLTNEEWDWLAQFNRTLRPADKREANATHPDGAFQAIVDSVLYSEAAFRVTGENGEPLVLYGKYTQENLPGRLVWCMATTRLKPYEREFARVSRKILRQWADEYGLLWNAVGEFNTPAQRWLRWCGAKFGDPLEMGGETFIRFFITGRN